MSLSTSFSLFLGGLLCFTIYLYKDAQETIVAKDMEINSLRLTNEALESSLSTQNASISKLKANNTKLNQQLIDMRSDLYNKYYSETNVTKQENINDYCERMLKRKLNTFIKSINEDTK